MNGSQPDLMRRRAVALLGGLALILAACSSGGNNATSNTDNGLTNTPAPPPNAVTISMLYGSEKQAWVDDVTAQFNNEQHKLPSGQVIFVQTTPIGSGDSMNAILNGSNKPTIWSPASSIWLPLANDGWLQKGNTTQLVDTTTCKN